MSAVASWTSECCADDMLATLTRSRSQVGDVKHSDLPGMEALGREGKKDGQVIMIKNEGKVEAYSVSKNAPNMAAADRMSDSGPVQRRRGSRLVRLWMPSATGGSSCTRAKSTTTCSMSMSPKACPLSNCHTMRLVSAPTTCSRRHAKVKSENPWVAAQKFLEKNDLPSSYTEQVVAFIEKSTDGVKLGGDSSTFVDPYTGASRYTGGSGSTTSTGYSDPFTGEPRSSTKQNSTDLLRLIGVFDDSGCGTET